MNCFQKTAFGAKNSRISIEVGMMPTVVSVRHGEHLTSTPRIGVLTPLDDRGILLYIPTRAPSPASGIDSSTSWDRWFAWQTGIRLRVPFPIQIRRQGRSVETGPEGGGTLTRRSVVVSPGEFLVLRVQYNEYCSDPCTQAKNLNREPNTSACSSGWELLG